MTLLPLWFRNVVLVFQFCELSHSALPDKPGNCKAGKWTNWGPCSVTCGYGGTKFRTLLTTQCKLSSVESKPCSSGVVKAMSEERPCRHLQDLVYRRRVVQEEKC
ncbi:thrombospondin type-1 domain-containing protein 7A-like [Corticium candelabrum]|uniref:thrombospondin type-1 domain-containing protein 7A-like n=1 Tax=Corticium candelabrum TaxID=121492 RepID=UPI002E256CF4|nr:thrombospondin type-1 domain-containing protein 7A-like [Corticium candelabrum]